MQNQYTGDIGDFAKYGLLRAIKGKRRLVVAWYLHPDERSSNDGRFTQYLDDPRTWRDLDPQLFDTLGRIVRSGKRSVGAVQASGILGNAKFMSEPLDITAIPIRKRSDWRRDWFERVVRRLGDRDLVFADPDNGLYPDADFCPTQKESAKRIPLYEAKTLAQAQRPVVIYHHNTRRKGGHHKEIEYWMEQLPGCAHAYYWRRWSNRTFFVLNAGEDIHNRLVAFAERWKPHGELIA